MKLKDSILQYLNDLPNRWSANFLALLGGVHFIIAIIGAFITTLYEIHPTLTNLSVIKFIKFYIYAIFSYSIELFPVSCFLSTFIAIFYILLILSNKRYFVVINLIILLTFFVTIFILNYECFDMTRGGAIFLAFILLANIIVVPLSILIYLILLIIEHFSKFKIPESLVSKNSIFKKFITSFYCYYFIAIFSLFVIILYWLIT